MRDEEH